MNYNDDTEGIVEFPLTSEEIGVLRDIYSKFVVELGAQDVSRPEALSAIIKIAQKVSPHWVLKNFVNDDEFKVIKDGGMIRFVFDEDEGGEKMNYETKVTSGEVKVAQTILDHFGQGFKIRTPTVMTFMSCLRTALPTINKKVSAERALKVMIRGGFLEIEEEGEPIFNFLEKPKAKVVLGPEGEKYLSP
jgi:hypothetical protein